MDYSKAVDRLIARQLRDWDEAGRNYAALASTVTRSLHVGSSTVVLQFNPERVRSAAAAIDKRSLARRKCFLCSEHQPARQRAILWGDSYKIQVNPYPIFSKHLTIADLRHQPQRLVGRVGDMLRLAQELPPFVIFYNGPQCGASAPDHMHFQAGVKGEMPLCDELSHATTHLMADSDEGFIGYVDSLGRSLFTIETSTIRAAERYALRLFDLLSVPEGGDEPMVNVMCWWEPVERTWHMVVFPRRKHRPACYGDGPGQLMLSPATAEMGGLWPIPSSKDFDSLTALQLQALYDELCLTRIDLAPLLRRYSHNWDLV